MDTEGSGTARITFAVVARACAPVLLALGLCHGAAAKADADDEIIVQLRERADIAPLLVKHQLSLIGRFGQRPIYRLKLIGQASLKQKVDALRREWEVRSVEPNATTRVLEPDKNVPWAIGDPQAGSAGQWAAQAIRLPEAQQITTGRGVRVAVLDTGVDRRHPALATRLLRGFDFVDWDPDPSEEHDPLADTYGHGTHVAGLVALAAPGARIMPLRVLDARGYGNAWVLAEAMLHAVDPDGDPSTDDGAHVINLSLSSLARTELFKTVVKLVSCKKGSLSSGPRDSDDEDDDDTGDEGVTLGDKARCSGFGGAVVVAAAGNLGTDKVREYPAGETSSSLLSVGASDREGWLAPFSNHGWVKLAAPGAEITSAVPGGGYGTWSGTSMATPLVAGAAALVRSVERELSADKVVKRLRDRGARLCGTSMRQLDALAALDDKAARRDKTSCEKRRE
ncbi:MAG: S8 family serine peptidase [Betaproteobacteria bacterium]|nr:S8 family serine peptidase [Betaproteobacteria bacterium]